MYCKMYSLGPSFCEVCKEELRKAICRKSNVTMLFFQKYADEIRPNKQGKDMSEYFIFRKGYTTLTGDKIKSGLTLSYYNSNNTLLECAPNTPGTYKVKATFLGDNIFDPCEQVGTYEILEPYPLLVESKVYDGKPIFVKYTPTNVANYSEISYSFTGKIIYSDTIFEAYNSAEPPHLPGEYSVTARAMNNGTCVSEDNATFSIDFLKEFIVDNRNKDLAYAQDVYRTRNIMFAGEGFTEKEQSGLKLLAMKATATFRTTQPYAEFHNYMSFSLVNTISKVSGIGSKANDTFFGLKCESGKIKSSERSALLSEYLQKKYFGELLTMYGNIIPGGRDEYSACIIFVNDANANVGLRVINGGRITLYVPANSQGISYAVKELANAVLNKEEGFSPTNSQKEQYIKDFRKSFFYRQGGAYIPFIASGYNENFTYTGAPIDLTDYFHLYVEGEKIDSEQTKKYYSFSYFADNNGVPGANILLPPKDIGSYFVAVKLVPTREGYSMDAYNPVDNRTEYFMPMTAFTKYNIVAQGSITETSYDDYIDFKNENCEHNIKTFSAKEPTCTQKGWNSFEACIWCDYSTKVELPANSHSLTHVEKKDSTTTSNGNIEHWACSVCGKNFSDNIGNNEINNVVIPKLDSNKQDRTKYVIISVFVVSITALISIYFMVYFRCYKTKLLKGKAYDIIFSPLKLFKKNKKQ